MRRSRVFLIVCGALLALLLVAPGVSATPPTREPGPPFEGVLKGVCLFPVEVVTLANREKLLTFYDRAGDVTMQIGTGTLKVRLTNLATGTSLAVNISGPVRIAPGADGTTTITLGGRSLLYLRAGIDLLPPGITLNAGQQVITVDAEGRVTAVTRQTGSARDLCAELAR